MFTAEYSSAFRREDVVLAAADRSGLREFRRGVETAHRSGRSVVTIDGIEHHIIGQDSAAEIAIGSRTVVWRLDDRKLEEILALLDPLIQIERPAHQYVDGPYSPASTLVLSVDEYV